MNVKICGLTRAEDARVASERGAWALGFILTPGHGRSISLDRARECIAAAPGPKKVGVFTNAVRDDILRAFDDLSLDFVQLHGPETPEFCRTLGVPYIKVFHPAGVDDLAAWADYDSARMAAVVIEAPRTSTEAPGGRGVRADATLARTARERSPKPLILAGGLRPDNVAEAIRTVQPFAVDVSSGVESSLGVKDPARLAAFFAAVQGGPHG